MKLELEQGEIEAILNLLGQAPYAQVASIIAKIQSQAQSQIKK